MVSDRGSVTEKRRHKIQDEKWEHAAGTQNSKLKTIVAPLPHDLRQTLHTVVARLAVEPQLPWLLAGGVAQALGGVELATPPKSIAIITGAAEVARIVALLDAVELEPLATRSARGFARTMSNMVLVLLFLTVSQP